LCVSCIYCPNLHGEISFRSYFLHGYIHARMPNRNRRGLSCYGFWAYQRDFLHL
jgi:hypothetical protein